jgi:GT2 family glycosyltransferase
MNRMTRNTIESLKTKHKVSLFVESFTVNNGYNAALNAGISKGKNPIIAACNNDLMFHDGAVDTLVKALGVYDSVSPWCPRTHFQYGWKQKPTQPVGGYQIGKELAGWCIFLRRETWERIEGFDERLKFWCCDNAYAEQLKIAKLSHALIPFAQVTHLQSQTLKRQPADVYEKLTKFELDKFYKIYGNKKSN